MKIAICIQVGTRERFCNLEDIINEFIKIYICDLYIACDHKDVDFFLNLYPCACVMGTPNIGTDLGKFLYTLKAIQILDKDYDILLKAHTKKPSLWTFDVLQIFRPAIFNKIQELFENPKIGIVGINPHPAPLSKKDNNIRIIERLMKLYQAPAKKSMLEFQTEKTYNQIQSELDLVYYQKHPSNLTLLPKRFLSHYMLFGLLNNLTTSAQVTNETDTYKFVCGTIFTGRYSLYKKYLPIETIDFFLSEIKAQNERNYVSDLKQDRYTHSLERLCGGLFAGFEGLDVIGVDY